MSSQAAEAAYKELVSSRRTMNEVMQVYRSIDQKMQSTLLKIQSVHQEQGEAGAKSIGDLEVVIQAVKGIEKGSIIKVSLDPEDGCKIFQSESNHEHLEWENEAHFPTTFQLNTIVSREAQLVITVVNGEDSENIIKEFQMPVLSLVKNEIDAWYALKEKTSSSSSEVATEETVASLVQEVIEEISDQVVNGANEEETEEQQDIVEKEEQDEAEKEIPSIHIIAKLTLSEVERLAQNVLILSKQKNELELARQAADQKLTAARARHEQVTKSEMNLKAQLGASQTGGSSTLSTSQRRSLLGATGARRSGAAGGGAAGPQTPYQRYMAKVRSFFTPRRLELTKTVGIFVGSVFMFHFHGENFAV